jgi:hypothetical protein
MGLLAQATGGFETINADPQLKERALLPVHQARVRFVD